MQSTWKALRETVKICSPVQLCQLVSSLTAGKQLLELNKYSMSYDDYLMGVAYHSIFIAIVRAELKHQALISLNKLLLNHAALAL